MIELPEAYIIQMKEQLGNDAEADAFFHSYTMPRTQGLRVNPSKVNVADDAAMNLLRGLFSLEQVPWCGTGFYYEEETRPGRHPYHAAGLYYIQEPSAMSAVELLDPQPGDIVLDLAAAPGGKSTQIAGKLGGEGLLISNEIHGVRAKALSENIERMGVRNAVVVSASPQQLAARFPRFFDKMMVDAPCSGEGMFRKDPDAVAEWSPAHVEMCAARQLDILESAIAMLKPGGRIAYSTCTFNELENERTVEQLTRRFPELTLERTERIWPHRQRGEGHFVAVLRLSADAAQEAEPAYRQGQERTEAVRRSKGKRGTRRPEEEAMEQFRRWAADSLNGERFPLPPGETVLFGEQLYWLPSADNCPFDSTWLPGLKILRPGLHLAEIRKGRVEPSHALALAIPRGDQAGAARQTINFKADDEQVLRYLKGETLPAALPYQGWVVVAVDDYPLGWGKQSDGQVKNHYPKGLRKS
ncbi:RsmF rRNA methyltransferase first C-terminal domain-containing protein [Paenibacillus allorhizosphaerae]|uniref:Ribosomal RNA small subunit methyltransferase F n=1 Tax=Paenibacillus allorhizosphaerae TaxID=2849866 RepID=A0ABM8VN49_9BACL|nr:RsmF rRNA methyltransferase first C-terminal domain-containing protein [Paenibacillus allorhizosphaerae]CAG7650908.1 Ribosomal RNA small subunit methyltransferase F [Paenibacillus allorhizosphaerae]